MTRTHWLILTAALTCGVANAQGLPTGGASSSDYTGVWRMVGGTVFDRSTAEPGNAVAGQPGARERPPYNAEWEKKYLARIELVKQDKLPDPISNCGTPIGFPRIFNAPDGYEFVVTPKQTWILTENGPNTLRIYTDGRKHLPDDFIWPTYTGDSVGSWQGDTLTFTTIGLRGEDGTIVDRTGIILSDAAHATTQIHKPNPDTIEVKLTLEDPKAFTRPWQVTKRFTRIPGGDEIRIMDYACAENNRNPVDADGKTLTLDSNGKVIDAGRARP